MMEKKLVVAIDGPAGAGKSTIAKLAAEELDYIYIDTGAMYRSVAWKFLQSKQDFSPELVSKLAAEMTITFKQEAKLNRVFVDGLEVTDEIRTPEVTEIVSKVSAVGAVREAMVAQQRRMGEAGAKKRKQDLEKAALQELMDEGEIFPEANKRYNENGHKTGHSDKGIFGGWNHFDE